MRSGIYVRDQHGKQQKFKLVKEETKSVSKKTQPLKKTTVKRELKISNAQAKANEFLECTVNVERMSKNAMDAMIAQVQRDGMLRRLEAKIRSLSCEN